VGLRTESVQALIYIGHVNHVPYGTGTIIGVVNPNNEQESLMGKYLIAWLLGVPAIVLLFIYLL
jgi:hypothetical protein